jgi:hypothetical protein
MHVHLNSLVAQQHIADLRRIAARERLARAQVAAVRDLRVRASRRGIATGDANWRLNLPRGAVDDLIDTEERGRAATSALTSSAPLDEAAPPRATPRTSQARRRDCDVRDQLHLRPHGTDAL